MSAVTVEAVSLPGAAGSLMDAWSRVYEGDPHWVPPLRFERRRFFDPARNPYFRAADVQCFVARSPGDGGRPVGTIAATVDHAYQEHDAGVGFFGFFEFVDDLAVARALLEAAAEWLRGRGMKRAIGPFNFNTNHEFGLLVDGFDTDPCVANPHNASYFEPIYEQLGMVKAMDWYAYWLDRAEAPERISKVARRFLKRHPEVVIRPIDKSNYWREVEILHDIYDDAWEQNWAHVRISEEEFRYLAAGFKALIDPRLCFVVEVAGEPAAMSVSLPDMNQVVKKMKGRLFPTGWWHLAFGRRRIDVLRIFMLGVKKEFQGLPLGAILYLKTWEEGLGMGFRGGEASLVLENNARMRGPLEKMGARIYKTYRSYEVAL